MITTKRHRHSRGVLPLKAPPWIHDHHHQYVISLLLITYSIFLHQLTSTSFTTGSFVPIDNSPPLPSNQLLLDLFLDQTLFPTNSKNKNHQTTHPSPANTLHPITSSHRPPPPPLPTTTLPSSGPHVHVSPTTLSTHTLYQFPRIIEKITPQLDQDTTRRTKILTRTTLISTKTTMLPLHSSSLTTTTTMNYPTPPTGSNEATPPDATPKTLFEQVTTWFLESKYPASSPASPNTSE